MRSWPTTATRASSKTRPTGKLRLYYQADAFEPFGVMPKLLDLGEGRIAEMDAVGVDCRGPLAHRPRLRAARPRGRAQARQEHQRLAGRRHRQAPRPLRRLRRPLPQGRGRRGEGAGALRQGARLQGLEDPLQLRRLVPRREAVLADPRQGGGARRARLPASGGADDPRAADLRAGAGRRRLRLRHRDGHGHGAPHPLRRLRCLPQAADHPGSLRRGASVQPAAHRSSRSCGPTSRPTAPRCPT